MKFYQYFSDIKSYVGHSFIAQTGSIPVQAYHIDSLKIDGKKLEPQLQRDAIKAISQYNQNGLVNKDPAIQLLLHILKKSEFFDDAGFNRNNFIIKVQENGRRFSVSLQGTDILFKDFDIWNPREIKFSPSSELYHTSMVSGLKYLNPSMGGIGTHSIYSQPRIYLTKSPCTAGGWPLLKRGAREAIKDLENIIKQDSQRGLKFLVKWLAHAKDLTVYKLGIRPTEVYIDPETVQEKSSPSVYYVNTRTPIPVSRVNPDDMIDYEFLSSSPIINRLMKAHPEIDILIGKKIEEHQMKHPQKIFERTKWREL